MMTAPRRASLVAVLLLAAGGPTADAHHSFAAFDRTKQVTLTGVVREFQWTNPHAWIQIVVTDEQGREVEWGAECGSPNMMVRTGWKSTTLHPGDRVTAVVNPLLDGRCGDSEWTGAARTPLGSGVTLLAQDNGAAVLLCLLLPPGSLGTYDLYLEAGDGTLYNLHSSAQNGERVFAGGAWPEQWHWRNNKGWFGPPVPFAGFDAEPDGSQSVAFAPQESRELEIRKARFGLIL